MKFYLDPSKPIDAVVTALRADSTLRGASYLNGTNKIFSRRLPNDATLPAGVVSSFPFRQGSGSDFSGRVRIFVYTSLLSNGQVDPKGDVILAKCEELLSQQSFTITGMTMQPIQSLGITSSFFDSESDKTKARGVLDLLVTLGYN